jgi:exo-beta-1,3-glucanase (GH17 family)
VRGIVVYAEKPVNEDDSGRVEEDEVEKNFVRFDGGASHENEVDAALMELSNVMPVFRANVTVTVAQDGYTGIGNGTGSSIISQQDADKIALAAANRMASWNLIPILPPFIGQGDQANDIP